MTARIASRLAWGLWALSLALSASAAALTAANGLLGANEFSYPVGFLVFVTIGAVIGARRPEHAIGWLFCAVGLLNIVWAFATQFAVYAFVTRPGSLPGGTLAAWLASGWSATTSWGLMATFVLLLFPTGRLPSSRWRPVAWLAAAGIALVSVIQAFRPGAVDEGILPVPNPAGIDGAAGLFTLAEAFLWPALMLAVAASALSLILRFRRARGDERQQLKWFAYAGVFLALTIGLSILKGAVSSSQEVPILEPLLFLAAITAVPVSAAIAILKHRLYDIDIVINRTLVYGALTATLAAVYFGTVVALQSILRALTGQESDLAIVASTLVIAALFMPLRHRIQGVIDRRFYRRRYDATLVLAAHRAALRDEVDVERLTAALVRAADDTMRPAHASLWLRTPEEPR